jgi:hypothetical protein
MSGFKKFDTGKPPMSLLPPEAMMELAAVLGFGAKKYDAHNWRKGCDWSRLSDAALRHIFAWIGGEDLDPESGLNHLAHAMCCLAFLIESAKKQYGKDDRYGQGRQETTGELEEVQRGIRTNVSKEIERQEAWAISQANKNNEGF